MTIVELVEDIVRKHAGEDAVGLLKTYESLYPPDISMGLTEDNPSFMDIQTFGGDIEIVGFWYGSSQRHIANLAIQDLIGRLLVPSGLSRLAPEYGNGPIELQPREGIPAMVALAAAASPFVQQVRSVRMGTGAADEVILNIDAVTPTGEQLGLALELGD
jgi:hypothetical protein